MLRLKKWLRQKWLWGNKPIPIPGLPPFLLPVERPSILTPSPSREAILSSMDSYGAFQLLPYEIRRQILIEAFGGRTLHIDLTYRMQHFFHKGGKHAISDGKQIYTKDKTWEWFSCVCHQPNLWPDGTPQRNFGEREIKNVRRLPCGGGCFNGRNHNECQLQGNQEPCSIGVMGWLLACRQAYAEGIDVIFTTNTIHMENYDLLQHLPRILLPQRLQLIQALEITWTFSPSVYIPGYRPMQDLWRNPTTEDSVLHEMCQMVPKLFPHVRRLDIHLHCDLFMPMGFTGWSLDGVERIFLGPIEDMIRLLGPGREVCIAIQKSLFECLHEKNGNLFNLVQAKTELYNPYLVRFWKELDPDNGLGYWICSGWPDSCHLGADFWDNY